MKVEAKTVPGLERLVKKAKEVVVMPRFGTSEAWIKITKAEATKFIASLPHGATAEEYGMYGGVFGVLEEGTLYLG